MNLKVNLLAAALLVCGVSVTVAQQAQEPDELHKVLKKDVGVWDAKMTMWMPGFDEPIEAQAVETNRMMGDFWLVSEFKAEIFGQPFEGHGQFGYDPNKEKFVGTWTDSMTPTISLMSGEWDYEKQTMTHISKGTNPETGGEMISKNVVVYESDDAHTMTMFMKGEDGSWEKSMEIAYTRKK